MDAYSRLKGDNWHWQHKKALVYQDFLTTYLVLHFGFVVQVYSSSQYQLSRGESIQGVEIKYDETSLQTGNFYFEVAEKATDRLGGFVDSGILSNHHWLYLIGNTKEVFLFDSNRLRECYKHWRQFQETAPDGWVQFKTTTPPGYTHETSRGMIIRRDLIFKRRLFAKHISFDEITAKNLEKIMLTYKR